MPLAAPVLIDSNTGTTGASLVNTAAGAHAAGQTLFAAGGMRTTSGTGISSSDSVNGSYAGADLAGSVSVVNAELERLVGGSLAINASDTCAVSFNGTHSSINSAWFAVSGIDNDNIGTTQGTHWQVSSVSTDTPSSNITPPAGNWILIGLFCKDHASEFAAADGTFDGTIEDLHNDVGSDFEGSQLLVQYRIVTADGLTAYSFTPGSFATARSCVTGIYAYPELAAAAAGGRKNPFGWPLHGPLAGPIGL